MSKQASFLQVLKNMFAEEPAVPYANKLKDDLRAPVQVQQLRKEAIRIMKSGQPTPVGSSTRASRSRVQREN